MKRKRNHASKPSQLKPAPAQIVPKRPLSVRRLWGFRFAALLLPLLVLGLVELALRVTGYGRPTAFYLKVRDHGATMLTDNPWFGWRFFPPAIARSPRPFYLATPKPADTVRIFVFGESAAMGDPAPAYGFARQLECLLRARHPDHKVEVVNAAMTAINSHVIREIAHNSKPYEGDFWLVFAGNNEVIGPFGAGTIFGPQAPSLTTVRTALALKATRLGQLLTRAFQAEAEPKQWEGLEFFLQWKIAADSPRLERIYASFAANLEDIARYGRNSGATVLLSTIPVNLHDFPPLASIHRPDLSPEHQAAWEKLFASGIQAQAEERLNDALIHFNRAAEIDDTFAQLAFERARCELALGQATAAANSFRHARDLDALRFRADSRLNDIIRQTAQANGTLVVDADAEFARFPEQNLFFDHVHLNFTGNYRAALLFAAELEQRWPGGSTNHSPWLTEAEVARRLAWTGFDEARVGAEMRARLQQPPFNAQSNFHPRDQRWKAALAALAVPPTNFVSDYQSAISLTPDDWVLRANFGRLLMTAGDSAGATTQWEEVTRLLPRSPEGWANRGRLARMAGDSERARELLQEALARHPDSVQTRTELGILEADAGNNESARRQFRAALRWQPGFAAARVNLGLLLAREGNPDAAAAEYRAVLRWQTNNVEARINLANLLTGAGRTNEALTLYGEAVALHPDNPVARYNLGRLLAANGAAAAAVTNFQAALQERPDLGEIHFELGAVLAGLGRDAEALRAFGEAARLNPDFADARFNYGVSLARTKRYREAVEEFRATLRLRPQDDRARRMLDQAIRLGQ